MAHAVDGLELFWEGLKAAYLDHYYSTGLYETCVAITNYADGNVHHSASKYLNNVAEDLQKESIQMGHWIFS